MDLKTKEKRLYNFSMSTFEQDAQEAKERYEQERDEWLLTQKEEVREILLEAIEGDDDTPIYNQFISTTLETLVLNLVREEFHLEEDDCSLFTPIVNFWNPEINDELSWKELEELGLQKVRSYDSRILKDNIEKVWIDKENDLLAHIGALSALKNNKIPHNYLADFGSDAVLFSENRIYCCNVFINIINLSISVNKSEIIHYAQIHSITIDGDNLIIYHTTGQVRLYLDTDEERQTARGLRSLLDAYLEEK